MRQTVRSRKAFVISSLPLLCAMVPGCSEWTDSAVRVAVGTDVITAQSVKNTLGGGGSFAGGGGNFAGGGSNFAGGGGQWGGGGGLFAGGGGDFAGGGGFWSGGGSWWNGGGGNWGGGGGQWSGGTDVAGGGGWWNGGGGSWNGGGGSWGGGGNWWGGGGGNFAGGGGFWGGGGGNWNGGGGLWSGGFASAFPFLGWAGSRNWQFRGIPQPGYVPWDTATLPTFSGALDTSACTGTSVRLGGFARGIDVDGWAGFLALGYSKALCVPAPTNTSGASQGLAVQAVAADMMATGLSGYALGQSYDSNQVAKDRTMLTSLVGEGGANVATQYGGALCASIGTLAAAKRSCAVGIANTDPNTALGGGNTARGEIVKVRAQQGVDSRRIPFGRPDGFGQYGEMPGDMESYATRVLRKHNTLAAPTAPSGIGAWNASQANTTKSFTGSDFSAAAYNASPNAAALQAAVDRSAGASFNPLNLVPVSGVTGFAERVANMQTSLEVTGGSIYAMNLHSVAAMQNPLYGSGGGRWYFRDPSDPNAASKPLIDVASVYQGQMRVLTGFVSPTNGTLNSPFLSETQITYADWRPNPSGTLYLDHAGQSPTAVISDTDRATRLRGALALPTTQLSLGIGETHACAIKIGGTVQCWGSNLDARLGNSSQTSSFTPVDVAGLSNVKSIVAGSKHTCALTEGGDVYCWGNNGWAQLGTSTVSQTAVRLVVQGATSIAAGDVTTCAVLATGQVRCWGLNSDGQCGADPVANQFVNTTPTFVPNITNAVGVAASTRSTCALLRTGEVSCWGRNNVGQLGDGTTGPSRYIPALVTGLNTATALSAASWTHCARLKSGGVKCWGEGGTLGTGDTAFRSTPTFVNGLEDGAGVVAVTTNIDGSSCALIGTSVVPDPRNGIIPSNGAVKCWGANSAGQLGTGDFNNALTPVTTIASGAQSIAAGGRDLCARKSDGSVACAGSNAGGVLGTDPAALSTIPTAATSAGSPSYVSASRFATCGIYGGALKCWGQNAPSSLSVPSATPVTLQGITAGATSAALDWYGSCAVVSGAAKCWGQYSGNGTSASVDQATTAIASGIVDIKKIAAGTSTCALTTSGAVTCWGLNTNGELGFGGTISKLTPTQVIASGTVEIVTNRGSACARDSGGIVRCWGTNSSGLLGYPTPTAIAAVNRVTNLGTATRIAGGSSHNCAIVKPNRNATSGDVYCWGANDHGEIGAPMTTLYSQVPSKVGGMPAGTIVAIESSVASNHTCAITTSGALYCWGQNELGQLGDGSQTNRFVPVQVPGTWNSVTTGASHTCGFDTANALKCWGGNDIGTLGTGVMGTKPQVVATTYADTSLVDSQGSVLVQKFQSAGGAQVSGHVMPIAYGLANATTGDQALMVTYDPLAAAAAMFIEQYSAHVTACNNTTSTSITEAEQQAGTKLWACGDPTRKNEYLNGMAQFYAGARTYLLGRQDGCITGWAGCTSTVMDEPNAHFPHMFVVPDYVSTHGGPAYFTSVSNALSTYRSGVLASSATGVHKALQLAGAIRFQSDASAIVTTRVKRSGLKGTCTL